MVRVATILGDKVIDLFHLPYWYVVGLSKTAATTPLQVVRLLNNSLEIPVHSFDKQDFLAVRVIGSRDKPRLTLKNSRVGRLGGGAIMRHFKNDSRADFSVQLIHF